MEQQKQYNINKKSSKKAGNVKGEKNKTADNVHGANVQVQNLFEVNMMFNKAGCGLPLDEVTLISISMYEMARLNKFKKIRCILCTSVSRRRLRIIICLYQREPFMLTIGFGGKYLE